MLQVSNVLGKHVALVSIKKNKTKNKTKKTQHDKKITSQPKKPGT